MLYVGISTYQFIPYYPSAILTQAHASSNRLRTANRRGFPKQTQETRQTAYTVQNLPVTLQTQETKQTACSVQNLPVTLQTQETKQTAYSVQTCLLIYKHRKLSKQHTLYKTYLLIFAKTECKRDLSVPYHPATKGEQCCRKRWVNSVWNVHENVVLHGLHVL